MLSIVPSNASDYALAGHDNLMLNHAAYWLSLRNEEPDEELKPDSTRTVLVPATHLLTVTTIRALVEGDEELAIIL